MSASHSQTAKKTQTANTTTSATQSISDAYNQTLSIVNNNTYGQSTSDAAGGLNVRMLAIAGVALAGLMVLAFSFKS
jgi:hypothetical protein